MILKFMKLHLPAILTGVSVVSTVGAVYFTYKAAPKIQSVISDPTLDKQQKFFGVCKAGAIPLILTAISGGGTISAQIINSHRLATTAEQLTAATATAALATKELHDFTNKTKEVVGEEKFKEIKKEVVDDHIAKSNGETEHLSNVTQVEHISTPGSGNTLWYDDRHDRWFRTSPSNVEEALKRFNASLRAYDFASYGEFYSFLGLTVPPSDEHVGFTSCNNPDGVSLSKFDTIEYPETGEIARVLLIENLPEIDPDWGLGQLL